MYHKRALPSRMGQPLRGRTYPGGHAAPVSPRLALRGAPVANLVFRDLALRVACRPDAGTAGEGCGVVFDAAGSDDYFEAHADALEGVVRLVHVRGGE